MKTDWVDYLSAIEEGQYTAIDFGFHGYTWRAG